LSGIDTLGEPIRGVPCRRWYRRSVSAPDPSGPGLKPPMTALRSSPSFSLYIGIDYSGAETPTSPLRGLRIYQADRTSPPEEVKPPQSPRKYWTRHGVAEWLVERLREDRPALVGIDHGFSFPRAYFEAHHVPKDWSVFLDDFQRHWPTDESHTYVQFIRDGLLGDGLARLGESSWRRLTEIRAGVKSVFHFDVRGSVANSTHAGLPWLRYITTHAGNHVHIWPFDGWNPPTGRSVVAEVYPALWSSAFSPEGRTSDQHDAYSIAEWMRQADRDGVLRDFFSPSLTPSERAVANIEGWILGVK
jgi:hypothetical protein